MSVLLKGPHALLDFLPFFKQSIALLCSVFLSPSYVYLCFPVLGRMSAAACLGVNTGVETAAKSCLYTHQHSHLDLIPGP